jgi:hypothetical protein
VSRNPHAGCPAHPRREECIFHPVLFSQPHRVNPALYPSVRSNRSTFNCAYLRPLPVTTASQRQFRAFSCPGFPESLMCWRPRPTRLLCWCREEELNPQGAKHRRILSSLLTKNQQFTRNVMNSHQMLQTLVSKGFSDSARVLGSNWSGLVVGTKLGTIPVRRNRARFARKTGRHFL